MCFSLEASFASAAVLGAIAYKNLTLMHKKSLRPLALGPWPLALIPLLFSFQQFIEGIVWFCFRYSLLDGYLFSISKYIYVSFVYIIWPPWVPLAIFLIEKQSWRKKIIFIFVAAALLLSLVNVYHLLHHEIVARVFHHSIEYIGGFMQGLIYLPIVLMPLFLSSLRSVRIAGIIQVFTIAITLYFYRITFISVWCFFSTVMGLMSYVVLKDCIRSRVSHD